MVARSGEIWLNPVLFEFDVLGLVNTIHQYSRDTLLRLGSFALDRSLNEIMDHTTNTLVEFIDLDARRESSVHCCMENHRMVWVGRPLGVFALGSGSSSRRGANPKRPWFSSGPWLQEGRQSWTCPERYCRDAQIADVRLVGTLGELQKRHWMCVIDLSYFA